MDYKELMQRIRKNELARCYVFSGEERSLKLNFVKIIQEKFNLTKYKYEQYDLKTIWKLLNTKLSNNLIIIDNNDIVKDLVKLNIDKCKNILICLVDKDKSIPDNVQHVTFDKMDPKELADFAQSKIDISKKNATLLVAISENNMDTLKNNLAKLSNYTEKVTESDIEKVCFIPHTFKIFDMIDAICSKEKEKSLYIYNGLDESGVFVLSLLYSQFRKILWVKCCLDDGFTQDKIKEVTGINGYIINNCIKMSYNYTKNELLDILKKIFILDQNIKTGIYGEEIAYSFILDLL